MEKYQKNMIEEKKMIKSEILKKSREIVAKSDISLLTDCTALAFLSLNAE